MVHHPNPSDEDIIAAAKNILKETPQGLGNTELAEKIVAKIRGVNPDVDKKGLVENIRKKIYHLLRHDPKIHYVDGHIKQYNRGTVYRRKSHVWVLKTTSSQPKSVSDTSNLHNQPHIQVTSPIMRKMNSWNATEITEWLKNPIGNGNGKNDFLYKLSGKVSNCPNECNIQIWIRYLGKIWSQIGGDVNDQDGSWEGSVFLKIEDVEKMTKTLRVDIGLDLFKNNSDTPLHSEIITIK